MSSPGVPFCSKTGAIPFALPSGTEALAILLEQADSWDDTGGGSVRTPPYSTQNAYSFAFLRRNRSRTVPFGKALAPCHVNG